MVWKVQFLQFFRRVLLFGHSSKQHGSRMQQIGQQLLSCCGFATRNTHHLMSENFYVYLFYCEMQEIKHQVISSSMQEQCFPAAIFMKEKYCKNHYFHMFSQMTFQSSSGFTQFPFPLIVESIDTMIVEVIEN